MTADFSCPSAEVSALQFFLGIMKQLDEHLASARSIIIFRSLLLNLFQGFIVFGQALLDSKNAEYSTDKLGIGF